MPKEASSSGDFNLGVLLQALCIYLSNKDHKNDHENEMAMVGRAFFRNSFRTKI
jgi:hypothetical protein